MSFNEIEASTIVFDFDAITGKGNFNIGEFIALMMLRNFSFHNGRFGFLIKNSVVKNLIYDLKSTQTNTYRKLTIVTQKKIGQQTNYIKKDFPLTYNYLNNNREFFDKLYYLIDYSEVHHKLNISMTEWIEFEEIIKPKVESKQLTLF